MKNTFHTKHKNTSDNAPATGQVVAGVVRRCRLFVRMPIQILSLAAIANIHSAVVASKSPWKVTVLVQYAGDHWNPSDQTKT